MRGSCAWPPSFLSAWFPQSSEVLTDPALSVGKPGCGSPRSPAVVPLVRRRFSTGIGSRRYPRGFVVLSRVPVLELWTHCHPYLGVQRPSGSLEPSVPGAALHLGRCPRPFGPATAALNGRSLGGVEIPHPLLGGAFGAEKIPPLRRPYDGGNTGGEPGRDLSLPSARASDLQRRTHLYATLALCI